MLKVLKVLNFSGGGEGNTFTCTFTGDDPHPLLARPRGYPVAGTRPVEPGEGNGLQGDRFQRVSAGVRITARRCKLMLQPRKGAKWLLDESLPDSPGDT